ncbi:hypothetical protein XELAEV_18046260mg [Xenopus laevis]|uniref:Uncharacterized protein n=1 Tax=Xenopus laevis TaxID=8355 RepID=A0A974H0F8_XENLA|nr:hypothetical protein XELAEV_18046260mg [Xenopus laevis]
MGKSHLLCQKLEKWQKNWQILLYISVYGFFFLFLRKVAKYFAHRYFYPFCRPSLSGWSPFTAEIRHPLAGGSCGACGNQGFGDTSDFWGL